MAKTLLTKGLELTTLHSLMAKAILTAFFWLIQCPGKAAVWHNFLSPDLLGLVTIILSGRDPDQDLSLF